MPKRVVVVGSVNLDLVASADRVPVAGETISGHTFQTFFGGKGANQAVAVARLRHAVSMIAKVGDDAFGSQLKKALRQAGVDVRAVKVAAGSSGVALIATGKQGENLIVVVPGANGKLMPRDLDQHKTMIKSAGILLTQFETPLETVEYLAQLSRKFGVPLMLDPAPARLLPASLLQSVTWLTPNETEARTLLGNGDGELEPAAAASELLRLGVSNVILKLGEKGIFVAGTDGSRIQMPAFSVRAIDTTAAGDAFNGAFAAALMQSKSVEQSARFACAVAAISVTRHGAQPSMPSRVEVARFLNAYGEKN
jgi:ribokinase